MNSLTTLPSEILFHCVSGYHYQGRTSIRNFGFYCRHLRGTCTSLKTRIDACWQVCLDTLYEDWKHSPELVHKLKEQFPSFSFVINWIDGKPRISKPTFLEVLKNDFQLEIKHAHERNMCREDRVSIVPWRWLSTEDLRHSEDIVAYSTGELAGDISFFNLKTKKFIGELAGHPGYYSGRRTLCLDEPVRPIIHGKNAFILVKENFRYTLWHYEIDSNGITYKKQISLPVGFNRIWFMQLVQAHIVLMSTGCYMDTFLAFPLDELIDSNTPSVIKSEPLRSDFRPIKFNDFMLLRNDKDDKIVFQTIGIKDRKIEFNELVVGGDSNFFPADYSSNSALSIKDNHYVFQIYNPSGKGCTFGALSADAKHSPHILSLVHMEQEEGKRQLIKYKDSLLALSSSQSGKIKIETVDIVEGHVQLTPLDILGLEKEKFLPDIAYCHLDKLFLIGKLQIATQHAAAPYLLILNLHSQRVEYKSPLAPFNAFTTTMIELSPGTILVFNCRDKTILKIDYTT